MVILIVGTTLFLGLSLGGGKTFVLLWRGMRADFSHRGGSARPTDHLGNKGKRTRFCSPPGITRGGGGKGGGGGLTGACEVGSPPPPPPPKFLFLSVDCCPHSALPSSSTAAFCPLRQSKESPFLLLLLLLLPHTSPLYTFYKHHRH